MDILPCIKKKIKRKKNTKEKSKRGRRHFRRVGKKIGERERERERERDGKKRFFFFSKIYGNRIIGFRRNRRQSRSTHRELRVTTKFLEFRQTP